MLRTLFGLGLALTFVGADCSTPTGLTRSCPGAAVQNQWFHVTGSCGGSGTIEVSLSVAGQCALAVVEPSDVPLPSVGEFDGASDSGLYELAKGGWSLENPPMDMMQQSTSIQCTSAPASASGVITLTCEYTICGIQGDDQEPTCGPPGAPCFMHLTPAPANSPIVGDSADAGAGGMDAAADGGHTADAHESIADATKGTTGG